MHIHPNNNLALASLGAGREELSEIQAKRAAEVRRKLSAASTALQPATDLPESPLRVEALSGSPHASHTGEDQRGLFESDGQSGQRLSVKA